MGFNKCILPSVETLKEMVERDGVQKFSETFMKYDAIMGDSESVEFLEYIIGEYQKINRVE
jgi:hypothetical protein